MKWIRRDNGYVVNDSAGFRLAVVYRERENVWAYYAQGWNAVRRTRYFKDAKAEAATQLAIQALEAP